MFGYLPMAATIIIILMIIVVYKNHILGLGGDFNVFTNHSEQFTVSDF